MAPRRARLQARPGLAGGEELAARHHYIVLERSPAVTDPTHDRCRAGLNHLAFHAGSRADLDAPIAAVPGPLLSPLVSRSL